ncbi:integrating conjugative element protein [Gilliamella sp. B3804]|nr:MULTISPECIES: integrating conjugative element protein [unclassified Gilliamella]MCX8588479.1 integrating conjugative element protein [Gilliamella sp. B3801]MCX8592806.1 integrating conjugative element protein [Gilliamella sp. B3804]
MIDLYKRTLLISLLSLVGFTVPMTSYAIQTQIDDTSINTSGAVIDDYVFYNIGGGRAVSMSKHNNMQSIKIGAGWNSNLICGDMNLETTLQNQLNGVTNGFQQIMGNVINNATSAVASLPAMILQRADPALYNLLTNGILQARLDYDRSKLTCRAMTEKMADMAGGSYGWGQLAQGTALSSAVSQNKDAVDAIDKTEADKGNNGVPWVGGSNAGGNGQNPIKVVSDVTKSGYNLLNGRTVTDNNSTNKSQCGNNLVCQTWSSPEKASAFAVRILGEQVHQTCEGCTKTQTTAGVGLTPLIQETYEEKLKNIQELVSGSQTMTFENLQNAGSQSLPITRGVIEALRDEPDLDMMTTRLASEVALSSVMEQALLLQRVMITGSKEPNVASNDLAQSALARENSILEQEINNLNAELDLRQKLANNAAKTILDRHQIRSENSRTIYQGDPDRNRLQQIQKPSE